MISHTLRSLIRDNGMSPYELAKRANISPQLITRFLSGERGLTLATLDRIAPVLGIALGRQPVGSPTVEAIAHPLGLPSPTNEAVPESDLGVDCQLQLGPGTDQRVEREETVNPQQQDSLRAKMSQQGNPEVDDDTNDHTGDICESTHKDRRRKQRRRTIARSAKKRSSSEEAIEEPKTLGKIYNSVDELMARYRKERPKASDAPAPNEDDNDMPWGDIVSGKMNLEATMRRSFECVKAPPDEIARLADEIMDNDMQIAEDWRLMVQGAIDGKGRLRGRKKMYCFLDGLAYSNPERYKIVCHPCIATVFRVASRHIEAMIDIKYLAQGLRMEDIDYREPESMMENLDVLLDRFHEIIRQYTKLGGVKGKNGTTKIEPIRMGPMSEVVLRNSI